ncbi:MAG: peptide deformylase [Deltaproteobacteria bacterium]|nr:peptide deformylase [Deltaproteobacteria bacterium]
MAILKILTYPDTFLKQKAKPVKENDSSVQKLIDYMAETMYDAPGTGLAAIQVGSDKSIIVYNDLPGEEEGELKVLINPVIVSSSGETLSEQEGCLSVPEYREDVKRAQYVHVEGLDRDGKPVTIKTDEFLAIVLQHEIDHLNGILFIDRISKLKRNLYKKKVIKNKNRQGKD